MPIIDIHNWSIRTNKHVKINDKKVTKKLKYRYGKYWANLDIYDVKKINKVWYFKIISKEKKINAYIGKIIVKIDKNQVKDIIGAIRWE